MAKRFRQLVLGTALVCVAACQSARTAEGDNIARDAIHLPGIFVHRIVQGTFEKRIEQRTMRERG